MKDFIKDYSEIMDYLFKEGRPKASKIIVKILLFPIFLLFSGMILIAISSAINNIKNSSKVKYPSDKYKRVIKEGLFWDNIEYHER